MTNVEAKILAVGDYVECVYAGKYRHGQIVEIKGDVLRVNTREGFRCLKVSGIQNLKALCVGGK